MTETETEPEVEQQATEVEDATPTTLRTWGLSGQPSTWALSTWVPLIETIRAANHGTMDVAAVQEVLDATFPDAGYQAADIVLAHPPTAEFTIQEGTVDPDGPAYAGVMRVDLTDNEDLGLPNEQVTWDFGDGTATASDAYGYEHGYTTPGVYTVRCTIPVGGTVYSTSQEHIVGEQPEAEPAVDPAYAARDATTFTDPDELEEQLAANQQAQAEASTEEPVEEDDDEEEDTEETFDPAEHTVDEVLAYADEHPDEADDIAEAERAGKGRVTILDKLG